MKVVTVEDSASLFGLAFCQGRALVLGATIPVIRASRLQLQRFHHFGTIEWIAQQLARFRITPGNLAWSSHMELADAFVRAIAFRPKFQLFPNSHRTLLPRTPA